ncbi:MAG TPA: malto-oligosyltrehalose trehalohydrolase [Candidatus Binataceae bacterium]|nr:malto-oligosyltrehalose trehalohydrolase [Candidatus Binataceae bacterium]
MIHRSVWAPFAAAVDLVAGRERLAMTRGDGGWWRADLPPHLEFLDYAFSLDGAAPVPDPRSPFQPAGVHGFSRPIDHATFNWTDSRWRQPPLSSALIYELHVGTFTRGGTFDSVIDRLGYLAKLGVTHVELMPVAEFPGDRGWGYDGVNLFAPHHHYGGPEALKRLVDACHARGLAVILDVVYNHFGPDGNYLPRFGPYLTDRYRTPWGSAVNLDDAESVEVRRFFCDNALGWLRDYHIDGLRLDAVHAIFDAAAIHFLEQLAAEVKALEASLGRPLILIAESDLNQPRIVTPIEAGGYGLHAQWNDDFHHALHALVTGERAGYYADFGSLADLAHAITAVFVYDGRFSPYRRRIHGRPVRRLSGDRFVCCMQNHDQIGNRAKGDRLGHIIDEDLLKIAAALMLTAPFVPMLFQGEEWNASSRFPYFTDHSDPNLAEAIREGRRREFAGLVKDPSVIPDPQSPETFASARLDWSEAEREPHRAILEWYRALIRLRRSIADLSDGRLNRTLVRFVESARWFAVRRGDSLVVCNLAEQPRSVPVDLPSGNPRIRLASKDGIRIGANAIEMPPRAVAILTLA